METAAVTPALANWPDLSQLTADELISLRRTLGMELKEARRRATKEITKDKDLLILYTKRLNKPGSEDDIEFRKRLIQSPQAFTYDFVANSINQLDMAAFDEQKRRHLALTTPAKS